MGHGVDLEGLLNGSVASFEESLAGDNSSVVDQDVNIADLSLNLNVFSSENQRTQEAFLLWFKPIYLV